MNFMTSMTCKTFLSVTEADIISTYNKVREAYVAIEYIAEVSDRKQKFLSLKSLRDDLKNYTAICECQLLRIRESLVNNEKTIAEIKKLQELWPTQKEKMLEYVEKTTFYTKLVKHFHDEDTQKVLRNVCRIVFAHADARNYEIPYDIDAPDEDSDEEEISLERTTQEQIPASNRNS